NRCNLLRREFALRRHFHSPVIAEGLDYQACIWIRRLAEESARGRLFDPIERAEIQATALQLLVMAALAGFLGYGARVFRENFDLRYRLGVESVTGKKCGGYQGGPESHEDREPPLTLALKPDAPIVSRDTG